MTPNIVRKFVPKDLRAWDSVSHANITLEVEEAFDLEFDDIEIFSFVNVGAIHDSICRKKERKK